MSVIVAQLGARMHYAVPRIFDRAGILERLFTDICAVKSWPRFLRFLPAAARNPSLQRLATRIPAGIPTHRITAFTAFGVEYARRLAKSRNADVRNAAFLWSGREFCQRVISRGFGPARAVYAFNSAALELLLEARRRGLKGVLEQTIAPRAIECQLLADEQSKFPDWEPPFAPGPMAEYSARESAEWAAADLIICGSEFVRDGIVACGGPPDRCVVIPYGIQRPPNFAPKRKRASGPLRVLTVGAVGLRKGSPHILAAAKMLGDRVSFRLVGAHPVLPSAGAQLRAHLELIGAVPMSDIETHLQWADVFLLPSLCEGSATATYEALFAGLPVICTPQTGSVIRDQLDGFIVPPCDPQAIAQKLDLLTRDPNLLAEMSENARRRSADYTLEKYGERLLACLRERRVLPPA